MGLHAEYTDVKRFSQIYNKKGHGLNPLFERIRP